MRARSSPHRTLPAPKEFALLALITAGAIVVHGYHPYIEDAEIYVPGIKKALNPALYPYNTGFFASHARLSLFPNLIADSVKLTHLPFDWALLLWQYAAIFLLLLACWHLGRLCFDTPRAKWGGVALVASLLTIPVAGTALYIMDQYLTSRALSTPAILFVIVNTIERKFWRAGLWALFTAGIHPLMVVFGASYAGLLLWESRSQRKEAVQPTGARLLIPIFPPVTDAYREVLRSRSYFFLLQWEWYEWVGIFAPWIVFWWFGRIARTRKLSLLGTMCKVSIMFGVAFFAAGLIISVPVRMANFAELQPMRSLHLLYILLFVFAGGLLSEFVLKNHIWRWMALFVPLCAGMWFVQIQLFPASRHLELPGVSPQNDWVDAFLWIRAQTPVSSYFALDPDHMEIDGEDQHGFRALAERSKLADNIKDSGAVTMFPALAETWRYQTQAQAGWKTFKAPDFQKLKEKFGVDWVVLVRPATARLDCLYQNKTLAVCRID